MKITRQIIFWILLLLAGAWVVSTLIYHTGLPGSDVRVGRLSYWFRYTLEPHSNEPLDDELIGFVIIEGKLPSRFVINGGGSPEYQEVSMKWVMFSDGQGSETKGTFTVDLKEKQIIVGSDRFPLGHGSLRSLFGLGAASKQGDKFLDDLQAKLEAVAQGSMPSPQLDTYYLEEPPNQGKLQHYASGTFVHFPVLIWAAIWILLILATVIIRKANKSVLINRLHARSLND